MLQIADISLEFKALTILAYKSFRNSQPLLKFCKKFVRTSTVQRVLFARLLNYTRSMRSSSGFWKLIGLWKEIIVF